MKRFILLLILAVFALTTPVSALTAEQQRVIQSGVYYFNTEITAICSNIGVVNGGVDRFLQVLAYQESSGDPLADASPASSASGKYQYIDSTWRARQSLYGPAGGYTRAKQAPEPVQDAVAYIEYTQKFNDLGNDLFKLAVSHFLPAALTDESKLDVIPGNNRLTPRQYAEKLIDNIGKGIGSDIPLRYNEAPDFSVWLARVGGEAPTINASSANGGNCTSANGGTIVEIAEQEFQAGANERDGSNLKYGGARGVAWCGYFVSWVFDQAGRGFEGGPLPAVAGILAYAREKGYFHARGEAGFTPQPGDVVIYKEGVNPFPSHVNIVISYDATTNRYTSIGGNEGDTIKKQTFSADMAAITGFMRVQ